MLEQRLNTSCIRGWSGEGGKFSSKPVQASFCRRLHCSASASTVAGVKTGQSNRSRSPRSM
jgi:hypothetical protein